MELSPLKRDRASDEAYEALRNGILSRMFLPGERLQVENIAEQLGVSLTPVRQAMQSLAVEGLIDIRPRSGTYVAQLTSRDIREIFDIRCSLECLAAEKVAALLTDDLIAKFRELHQAMAGPIENNEDRKQHEQNNARFHNLLIESSDNRRLQEMYRSLNAHLTIARLHREHTDWAARLTAEAEEHGEILAALESHDKRRLIQAVRRHILRAKEVLASELPDDKELD